MTISRNLSFLAEGVSSTGVLGATYGGTGQNTVTTGDLLYGSATNTWSKLSIGSTGTILRVVGGIPSWGTDYTGTVTSVAASVPSFLSISGSPITTSGTLAITYSGTALPVANGGTGLTSLTAGYIPYGNGTSAFGSSSNLYFDNTNVRLAIGISGLPAFTIQASTGTNRQFSVLQAGTLSTGIALQSLNDAGSSNQGMEFRGTPFLWRDTAAVRMYLDANGQLNINGSSPTAQLDVNVSNQVNGINCGDFTSAASSTIPIIQNLGVRSDGNQTFGARFGSAFRRADGTAIASGTQLGWYNFGGQYGTDTSYQSSKLLYAAGITGIASGSFTSSTAMSTDIAFFTGSTGYSLTSANVNYGTERMRIFASGGVSIGNTTDPGAGNLSVSGTINTKGYTVATLPTGVTGARAYVTNALAPAFGSTVAGGGTVTIPVFYNGSNWIVG